MAIAAISIAAPMIQAMTCPWPMRALVVLSSRDPIAEMAAVSWKSAQSALPSRPISAHRY